MDELNLEKPLDLKKTGLNRKIVFFLALFLLIILSISLYFLFIKQEEEEVIKEYSPQDIVTYSVKKPSEKEVEEYQVAPDMPRQINMVSLKRKGYIQMVGIDQNGDIAVPTNVLMAGWYKDTVKPGQKGLSIITGHRDGIMKQGIFRHLDKLKKGDKIEIEYGDGSIKYFEIQETHITSIKKAYDIMYLEKEDMPIQLNLISCIGTYSRVEQTYDKRIIVIAKGI